MTWPWQWFARRPVPPSDASPLYAAVLDSMQSVQAYARSHGGEIELVSVSVDGDVRVRLHGTCRHCPLSGVTLKLGVERVLREQVPGVRRVLTD